MELYTDDAWQAGPEDDRKKIGIQQVPFGELIRIRVTGRQRIEKRSGVGRNNEIDGEIPSDQLIRLHVFFHNLIGSLWEQVARDITG